MLEAGREHPKPFMNKMRRTSKITFCLLISSVLIQGDNLSQQEEELTGNDANTNIIKKPKQMLGRRDFKQKARCCDLGRKMAKIGESCEFATTMANIHPNFAHFHMMKTSVWTQHSHPIKIRRLQKCRKFKVYFKKCCIYESSQIERDLQRMRQRVRLLKQRFSKKKPNMKLRRKLQRKSKPVIINISPRGQ